MTDVDILEVPAWPGRLVLTALPGQTRDMAADLTDLHTMWAVDSMAVLVEDHELGWLGASDIVTRAAAHGIEVIRFPIQEGSVPADAAAFQRLFDDLRDRLARGLSVAIACRAGLGRTGTVAACLCIGAGLDAEAAIARVRRTRPGSLETPAQEEFVRRF